MTHEELIERVKTEVFGLKWSAEFYDGTEISAETFLGEYDMAPMPDDSDGWLWNCRFEGVSRRAATFEDAKSDAEAHWLFLINAEGQARMAAGMIGEALLGEQKIKQSMITGPIVAAFTIKSLTQGTKE